MFASTGENGAHGWIGGDRLMAHDSDSRDSTAQGSAPLRQPFRAVWLDYDQPCTAIVEAVAAATGREHTDLPPLFDSIDTDSLNTIVFGRSGQTDGPIRVTFPYADVDVTIGSDGEIVVRQETVEQTESDVQPRTESDVDTYIQWLLNAATRNGVAVSGGWAVRNESALPDWDIHITRVAKPDTDADGRS